MDNHQGAEPLSLRQVEEWLKHKKTMPCPWCGTDDWGVHYDPDAVPTREDNAPHLRGLPQMAVRQSGASNDPVMVRLSETATEALPLVVVECECCGYLSMFNYYKLLRAAIDAGEI